MVFAFVKRQTTPLIQIGIAHFKKMTLQFAKILVKTNLEQEILVKLNLLPLKYQDHLQPTNMNLMTKM